MMKVFLHALFLWLTFCLVKQGTNGAGLIEVFRWKQMDYYNRGNLNAEPHTSKDSDETSGNIVFPDQFDKKRTHTFRFQRDVITSRDQPIVTIAARWNDADTSNTSSYIPYNNVPMGVTHYNGRLFITMPRRRTGIPSTLNYIDMDTDGKKPSPKLHAYPNFPTNYLDINHLQPNANRLISVYRTSVDECQRLWFIDTGMLEYPGNRTQVQRPAIWIIDLTNDHVIHRFEVPESLVETGRGLASITVEIVKNQCAQAYAYIPDLVHNQLFVYSLADNGMWAFSHNYFNFDPLGGDLSIGGQQFRWNDGIFSVTLGAELPNGYHELYFHAMASNNEFVVSTEVLQNESNAARSNHGSDFRLLGSRGTNRQSTMHEYDPQTGVLFYNEIQRNGVGCWNTNKTFSADNHGTVAQDAERMIYPSDLTIDEDRTIWVMTNTMPIFIYANLDVNAFNFHVWKQNVVTAAKDTVCE